MKRSSKRIPIENIALDLFNDPFDLIYKKYSRQLPFRIYGSFEQSKISLVNALDTLKFIIEHSKQTLTRQFSLLILCHLKTTLFKPSTIQPLLKEIILTEDDKMVSMFSLHLLTFFFPHESVKFVKYVVENILTAKNLTKKELIFRYLLIDNLRTRNNDSIRYYQHISYDMKREMLERNVYQ